ncbi:MAG: Rrf2 family transcriptional regulator [Clostridiaceae bacterium]|nr:Rrf2 family transcriptional regulator [Clostridiaceae bacterium]
MKVSTKGRYALRMMIDIAKNETGEWISIKDIARRQNISEKYLEQIVSPLTRGGLLVSSRGPSGGYMLSRTPAEYTTGEILRVIEGSMAPVACLDGIENLCDQKERCATLAFWQGLYQVINEYIDSITLQDLVNRDACSDLPDFSI